MTKLSHTDIIYRVKGLIIKNAYWDAPVLTHQTERMKAELAALGVRADIVRNGRFPAVTDGHAINRYGDCDFCVYFDKDKYASALLEKCGIRLFNTHAAIEACDDKMQTYVALTNVGIRFPLTLPGTLCYTAGAKVSESTLDDVEALLGYPVIIKACYGSRGSGVYKADDRDKLRKVAQKLIGVPHLFQKYVECGGKDLRVIVIGGKVLGCMERTGNGDFRANIGRGGSGRAVDCDEKLAALCEKCAVTLGLDYCGVDVLEGENGYELCEVNSNAFFEEFERVTGINVAGAYARHILRVTG